jgi:hypothetical protein
VPKASGLTFISLLIGLEDDSYAHILAHNDLLLRSMIQMTNGLVEIVRPKLALVCAEFKRRDLSY